jgi:hypothetical protein
VVIIETVWFMIAGLVHSAVVELAPLQDTIPPGKANVLANTYLDSELFDVICIA